MALFLVRPEAIDYDEWEEKFMRIGFIGTGEITSSIVIGLSSFDEKPRSIRLSPRNAVIAKDLADRFKGISIASSNQDVLDHADTIVIAVRPAATRAVLSELRFRPDHQVISLVSGLSLQSLRELVSPASCIVRAVPLPSTARRLSPTAVYPPEEAACELFAELGTIFAPESEREFEAICATTATIASYCAFAEGISSWLAQKGIQESKAREYISRLFLGVATAAVDRAEPSFEALAAHHATAGGINEQFLKYLVECGLLTNISEGLDAILGRIRSESQRPEGAKTD